MLLEVNWKNKIYNIDANLETFRKSNPIIKLPDGKCLKIDKWFPTKPPRPLRYDVIEQAPENSKIYIAKFIKEMEEKKEYPLKKGQVLSRTHNKKLKVQIEIPFEEVLQFTKPAFDQHIDLMILGEGNVGEIKEGELKNIEYNVLNVRDNILTLEVNAEIRGI